MKNSVARIMVCTPFDGLTDTEVKDNIHNVESIVTEKILSMYLENDEGYDQIEILYTNNFVNYQRPSIPCDDEHMDSYKLMCLANGMSNIMAECDAVVFANKWHESRGCMMEMLSALLYHKPIVALDEQGNVITREYMMDLVKSSINEMLNNV